MFAIWGESDISIFTFHWWCSSLQDPHLSLSFYSIFDLFCMTKTTVGRSHEVYSKNNYDSYLSSLCPPLEIDLRFWWTDRAETFRITEPLWWTFTIRICICRDGVIFLGRKKSSAIMDLVPQFLKLWRRGCLFVREKKNLQSSKIWFFIFLP